MIGLILSLALSFADAPVWQLATSLSETNYSLIGAGTQHSCVVNPKTPTEVWCWGSGTNGRLGLNSTTSYTTPQKQTAISGVTEWQQLSLGGEHSCGIALKSSGRHLYCWGKNNYGQLGVYDTTSRNVPTQSVNIMNGLAIQDAFHLALGPAHTSLVTGHGWVMTTGFNDVKQLGVGNTTAERLAFTYTYKYGQPNDEEGICSCGSAIHTSASEFHTSVVESDGYGYSVGQDSSTSWKYTLGFDSTAFDYDFASRIEMQETFPTDHASAHYYTDMDKIIQLDANNGTQCALRDTGTVGDKIGAVECMGYADDGRVACGVETIQQSTHYHRGYPAQRDYPSMTSIDDATKVTIGQAHGCILNSSGVVECWGKYSANSGAQNGMRGDGATGNKAWANEVVKCSDSTTLSNVVGVQAGKYHTIAISYSGGTYTVWSWGDNSDGQLGIGNTTDANCAQVVKTF